jgi:hypothetical protein
MEPAHPPRTAVDPVSRLQAKVAELGDHCLFALEQTGIGSETDVAGQLKLDVVEALALVDALPGIDKTEAMQLKEMEELTKQDAAVNEQLRVALQAAREAIDKLHVLRSNAVRGLVADE